MTVMTPDVIRIDDVLLYKIRDAMRVLSMSKTVIYQEMRSGRLEYVIQGTERRIPASAIHNYVALLKKETKERNR